MVQLSNKAVLASAGMQADQITLHKVLKARMVRYKQDHRKEMSTHSIAQMLSNTLYYKRFFPYYTFNVFGGIDENGVSYIIYIYISSPFRFYS
jgi:20S proteasome subunit beta 6